MMLWIYVQPPVHHCGDQALEILAIAVSTRHALLHKIISICIEHVLARTIPAPREVVAAYILTSCRGAYRLRQMTGQRKFSNFSGMLNATALRKLHSLKITRFFYE